MLPVEAVRDALASAAEAYGWRCLAYGANPGPQPLRERLADLVHQWDGKPCSSDNILVTAGTSHMLDHLSARLATRGDAVLVESFSYDLGCAIFRQHGLRLVDVECDQHGLLPAALDEHIARLRRTDRPPAFIYVIPTFHNPTGRLMPLQRRMDIVRVAARHRVPIIEDNAYRAVVLGDAGVPSSLLALADWRGVIQLSSFSKCLAPGMRLGWLTADAETVDLLAAGAMLASGGGLNHLAAMTVSRLLDSGWFDQHVIHIRREIAAQRDALVSSLRRHLPAGYDFTTPAGGFFLWMRLPEEVPERQLCSAAERHGISVAPGARFAARPQAPHIRLSFSLYPPQDLWSAGQRLAAACSELADHTEGSATSRE